MAKKAEPYKEGSGWSLRRRVFGQDFYVSGQPTKGAAEKAMQKLLTPLSERGKPKGLGPRRTTLAQALQDMACERLNVADQVGARLTNAVSIQSIHECMLLSSIASLAADLELRLRRRYSAWNLVAAARHQHADWAPAWRDAEPKSRYDVVIVGGGGHGLATAYYLAKNHGVTNVAVVEAGWIGGGNTGRNTTNIRSNYLYPESARLYDFSLKLYEELSRELNFNIMFSQRGMVVLAHSRHDLDNQSRLVNAMYFNGIDAELLGVDELRHLAPRLNFAADARFPIYGGFIQRRAGTARHDAVAWGYARGASALGVDIVQNTPVTGLLKQGRRVVGISTPRGEIRADKVALAVAGHSTVLADMAGFDLPVTSYALQAMVSEPVKPVLDTVILSPAAGGYWNQSDKGEVVIGGALDLFPSYAQRGSYALTQQLLASTVEMFPSFSRLRMLRQWAGIVDVVQDSSPIIGPTPVPGLYINCGWGTGGFKAIPVGGWTLAHLLATGSNHELAEPFQLERFTTGRLIDEAAAAGIAH